MSIDADEQSENVSSEEDTDNNLQASDEKSELVDSSTYSDPENDSNIFHAGSIEQHTLLENEDITIPASNEIIEEIMEIIEYTPGEGQKPTSDESAEYVAFPTIFCSQTRPMRWKVPVHYSDICKCALCSVDHHGATNIPNIFFKLKRHRWSMLKIRLGKYYIISKQKQKTYCEGYTKW